MTISEKVCKQTRPIRVLQLAKEISCVDLWIT